MDTRYYVVSYEIQIQCKLGDQQIEASRKKMMDLPRGPKFHHDDRLIMPTRDQE
jgi:hypothetical protein